jgi:hypothetical protein
MTRKSLTTTVAVGAAFAFAVPAGWANEPYRDHGDATDAKLALQSAPAPLVVIRDHGDATDAKLALQSSPVVARENAQRGYLRSPSEIIRDHGDATQAKLAARSPDMTPAGEFKPTSSWDINWSQLGVGFGIGMFFVLGLFLAVRLTRSQRLAH